MKIRDFTIFTENTRLSVNSSYIVLENPKIQGMVQYDSLDKSPSITLNIHAKVKNKDSLKEIKGLINITDF